MLDEIMDVLANLGLVMRDTRAKNIAREWSGLSWGAEQEGFALAIREVDQDKIGVALKNTSSVKIDATLPNWLLFYHITVTQPDQSLAELSAYGQGVLQTLQKQKPSLVEFAPEEMRTIEIPIAALFQMRLPGEYRITVTCPVPHPGSQSVLQSNELRFVRS
jgi:hypothetical protein